VGLLGRTAGFERDPRWPNVADGDGHSAVDVAGEEARLQVRREDDRRK
jgi:hypothetical protein